MGKKNLQVDLGNRIYSSEIGPHKYSTLILDKRTKTTQ